MKSVIVVCAALCIAGAVWAVPVEPEFVPGEVLIQFKELPEKHPLLNEKGKWVTGRPELDEAISRFDLKKMKLIVRNDFPLQVYKLKFNPEFDVKTVAEALSASPFVVKASPNAIIYPALTPNDPYFPDQWHLNNTGQTGGTPGADIDATTAWDTTVGNPMTLIAVLDTGIDMNHPDLIANIDGGGYDYGDDDSDPSDFSGHGTVIAGIIAGSGNNGEGITGVCYDCKIMPVKIFESATGLSDNGKLISGISHLTGTTVKIANMSFGNYYYDELVQDAIDSVLGSDDVLFVAAAGNDRRSDRIFYPAGYCGVATVAATDDEDHLFFMSNYGSHVDICAPGAYIQSAVLDDAYAAWSGTSMSAAVVSGVAGLVRALNGTWSAYKTGSQIMDTADNIESLNPGYVGMIGSGRVNAERAVTEAPQTLIAEVGVSFDDTNPSCTTCNGDLLPSIGEDYVEMSVALFANWQDATNVTGFLSSSDPSVSVVDAVGSWMDIGSGETLYNDSDPFVVSIDPSTPSGYVGEVDLAVTADGYFGNFTLHVHVDRIEHIVANISGVETWTAEDRYYIPARPDGSYVQVENAAALTIPSGTEICFEHQITVDRAVWEIFGSVTVEPGVNFLMARGAEIRIDGTWVARGNETDMICFSGPCAPDNSLITFNDNACDATYDVAGEWDSGCCLEYCFFQNISRIQVFNASPAILKNGFSECGTSEGPYFDAALYLDDSNAHVVGNSWYGGADLATAIVIAGGTPHILMNDIEEMPKHGILIRDAEASAKFEGNRIVECGGQGVFVDQHLMKPTTLMYNALVGNRDAMGQIHILNGDVTLNYNSIIEGDGPGISATFNYSDANTAAVQYNNIFSDFEEGTDFLGWSTLSPGITTVNLRNNFWGHELTALLTSHGCEYRGTAVRQHIVDYAGDNTLVIADICGFVSSPLDTTMPVMDRVEITPDTNVGVGEVEFDVYFSTNMETDPGLDETRVTFGPPGDEEYCEVSGAWTDARHWHGTYTIDAYTGDGVQRVLVQGARTPADVGGHPVAPSYSHTFTISTDLGPVEGVGIWGRIDTVQVSWQPSFEPGCAGYNLYYDFDGPDEPFGGWGASQGGSPINCGNNTFQELTFSQTILKALADKYENNAFVPSITVYCMVRSYKLNYFGGQIEGQNSAVVNTTLTIAVPSSPTPQPVPAQSGSGYILILILISGAILLGTVPRRRTI